jgi:hypothetical protein
MGSSAYGMLSSSLTTIATLFFAAAALGIIVVIARRFFLEEQNSFEGGKSIFRILFLVGFIAGIAGITRWLISGLSGSAALGWITF